MSRLLLSCAVLTSSLLACDPPATSSGKPNLEATVVAMSDVAIIPAAAEFETSASTLSDAMGSLCAGPTEMLVDDAREQWKATVVAWNHFALYDFGPMSDGVTPADAFIDSFKAFSQGTSYVQTLRESQRTIVVEGTDLTGEDFSAYNFQLVGLVAIEVALFETATEPPESAASAVADELVAHPNKCTYLVKQADLLAERAVALHRAWSPDGGDYRATFVSATNDALGAVLTGIHGHLEYLDKRNIPSQGYPVSGFAYGIVAANLDEVDNLLAAGDSDSLAARLDEARASELLADHEARITAARDAIATEDAEALGPELIGLAVIHQRSMPVALGIELGLNFTDGD